MTQPTNFHLNQWSPEDYVRRTDFNADNAKVEAALAAAGCGGQVLTLERDGERARRLYAARPWLWSAPAAAGSHSCQ